MKNISNPLFLAYYLFPFSTPEHTFPSSHLLKIFLKNIDFKIPVGNIEFLCCYITLYL